MDAVSPRSNVEAGRSYPGPGKFYPGSRILRAVAHLRPRSATHLTFVFLLYLFVSWAGNAITLTPGQADIIWPANGLLLAILLRLPRQCWAVYVAFSIVGNVLAHSYFHIPISQSLLFSAGNSVEVLVAALLLSQPDAVKPDLVEPRTLLRFVVFGVLLAPAVSSAFIELALVVEKIPRHWPLVINWFVGDVMGIAVVTPLVLAIEKRELAELFSAGKRFETIAILSGLAMLSAIVFALDGLPVDFLLIPALLLAIFRLKSSGAAIGIILMAGPAVYMTERSHGAFSLVRPGTFVHSIFILQCFLCVALILFYSVTSALSEKDRLQQEVTAAFNEADANAGRDYITGLANHRTFDKQLIRDWQHAVWERTNLSLLMIDVDRFKLYNDHYGHVAGDECLRRIADILIDSSLRSTDLVARYGGEEFTVILPGANAQTAAMLAERIRLSVLNARLPHSPYALGVVTISAGVATLLPTAGIDRTTLIEQADRALYIAKNAGRNRVAAWDDTGSV
jgi:diguanylate cyclase (GGDEF)-like protein